MSDPEKAGSVGGASQQGEEVWAWGRERGSEFLACECGGDLEVPVWASQHVVGHPSWGQAQRPESQR